MATTRKGQAASGGETTGETKKTRRRRKKTTLVRDVIHKIEEKLDKDELKPTVGDLVRLVQLEKELEEEEDRPKEIKVSWVERDEKEHASEK